MRFRFTAPLWEWSSQGGWFFVTLPQDVASDIREVPRMPRGFGSVRVRVTVGSSTWSTSVFPDSKRGSYLLPVKKAVRQVEGLLDGDEIEVALEVLDL
ncbi:DUF1905 domain-containing protein [Agromyces sp. SYSU K20354]|uniref:DUF1905 domain-containing protein n=1 Tax=Agromyces cavernae TaxID=2898659 RepID=UPI001E396B0E|nr:DUF1905 domain-containing protein [Agromyces cavernae]MCD2441495.1 DUF1905 domain-containing protein [Agromyces cavernae]